MDDFLRNENRKIQRLNDTLRFLQNKKRENLKKQSDFHKNDKEITPISEYYINRTHKILITLAEYQLPKSRSHLQCSIKITPQQLLIGLIKGDQVFTSIFRLLVSSVSEWMKNNYSYPSSSDFMSILGDLCTPNINRSLWIRQSQLVQTGEIICVAHMTLDDMTEMLRNCPQPQLHFRVDKCRIDHPDMFIDTVNNISKYWKMLNFIPYLKMEDKEFLNSTSVYYLCNNITVCDDDGNEVKPPEEQKIPHTDNDDSNDSTNNFHKKILLSALTEQDLNSLYPGNYVTNVVIDLFFVQEIERLQKEHEIAVWLSDYWVLFIKSKEVQSYKKRGTVSELIKNGFKKLIFPVSHLNHWLLIIIDLSAKKIMMFDSLKQTEKKNNNHVVLKKIKNLLETDDKNDDSKVMWSCHHYPNDEVSLSEQPIDSSACGLYCIMFFYCYFNDKPLVFSQQEVDSMRLKVLCRMTKLFLKK